MARTVADAALLLSVLAGPDPRSPIALAEDGRRTATLRAVTPCRVVPVARRYADHGELAEIARGHRREEAR